MKIEPHASLRGRRLKGKGKGGFGREGNAFLSHINPPFPFLLNACHAG